ncbi:MAG: hypothetical protein ABIC36_03045 [bacterium]
MKIPFFQKKLILCLVAELIILVLFSVLIIRPLINKIQEFSQEYLDGQEVLAKLDQRGSLFVELEKNYQEKQNELSIIESALLNKDEIVDFISNLETTAKQTGNIFEIKTASSVVPSEKDKEKEPFLTIRITFWGGFTNLLCFIASLEDAPYPPYRLIEIDQITINRTKNVDLIEDEGLVEKGDLETVLNIKIYTQ